MKYAIWGLLFIAVMPVNVLADDQSQIPWANKFFAPKDPPPVVVHDFGTVPWGTTLTHRFVMTNIYAVPMQVVKDPDVSCGCVKIVRYTQKLEARETGFIDIEMDGRRFQGAKAVTIQVRFGPKFQSTALLQVRAFGRTDVALNPGQINFNTVALGQEPRKDVDISYTGSQLNWQILGADTQNAKSVNASLVRLQSSQRGTTSYRLSVSLKPDAETGVLQEHILLRTNDAANPVLSIPIAGTVQAPLSVVQGAMVKFDPIPVGQEIKRNVMVRGNKPFQIMKIEGEGDGLKVEYTPITNPIQVVKITFKPTQEGELRRKITIFTDQKESTSVIIEATAEPAAP
ncbi:MAG: DUF1573 domain-containing protein [Planctomycetes bacterium]|nr:DUF1573 domain-containing protein [Planctomycetota bacterium]